MADIPPLFLCCARRRLGRLIGSALVLGLVLSGGLAGAAPLPPQQPADICGAVQSLVWLPPRSLQAIAGMSGSAGHARSWPGRTVVILENVRGPTRQQMAEINALLATSEDGAGVRPGPDELLLVLQDGDPSALCDAAYLCVTGFYVSGDEGGTWTHYDRLSVIERSGDAGCS